MTQKPVGWQNKRPDDPYRHGQAARGIKTAIKRIQVARKSRGYENIDLELRHAEDALEDALKRLEKGPKPARLGKVMGELSELGPAGIVVRFNRYGDALDGSGRHITEFEDEDLSSDERQQKYEALAEESHAPYSRDAPVRINELARKMAETQDEGLVNAATHLVESYKYGDPDLLYAAQGALAHSVLRESAVFRSADANIARLIAEYEKYEKWEDYIVGTQ